MKHPHAHRRIAFASAIWLLAAGSALRAGEVPSEPTPEDRAGYWLDRIIRGPEPASFEISNIHKDLLLDAERNLAAIPDASLARLADPELLLRVQSQEDANPWHAILSVLVQLGKLRPDVARAWAVPASRHELLTLRRAAIEVFEALHSPLDGPVLLEAIERDATDRLIGPRAALVLLTLGAPWDAAAARAVYARAPADGPLMTRGLWADLPVIASEAPGGARPDLLAWWGFLTESAGPRRADPPKGGAGKGRAIDPEVLAVVALPHALTRGARAASMVRMELARTGGPEARAQAARDRESDDPEIREVATVLKERPATDEERAHVRSLATGFVIQLVGASPPALDDVVSVARALRKDESPDALRLLLELFRAIPLDIRWKAPHLEVFEGLVVRGAPLALEIERLIGIGSDTAIDLALFLTRRSGGPAFIPPLERFLATPAAEPVRLRVRRELVFLYTKWAQHGGLPDDVAKKFANDLATWIEDSGDRSGVGLVATLADLGPAGEAELAARLEGPKRELYVAGLVIGGDHYVGADVTKALLAPLDRRTPRIERRRLLGVVFDIASSSATATLEDARDRMNDEGRADVDTVLRYVRHRYSISR